MWKDATPPVRPLFLVRLGIVGNFQDTRLGVVKILGRLASRERLLGWGNFQDAA